LRSQTDNRTNPGSLIASGRFHAVFDVFRIAFEVSRVGFSHSAGGLNQLIRLLRSAFHLTELSAHNLPLKYANNYRTETEKSDSSGEEDHPPLAPFYTFFKFLLLCLCLFCGYGLSTLGVWIVWRYWSLLSLFYSGLLWGFAAGFVHYGLGFVWR
jgi:hypothetical protein